ncbi:hypothetical protein [Methylocella silvestris]|uniref:Uncharacterized protein n=1 Tax=Methylocella silvestris TaxID=199596 RepID=A0A2J7TJH4_METSI|nr:hypothetical protein [Methylocella silvestris]PNG26915.1 hypothetical protein CR492_06320 [Methylocella silvestris]
MKKGLFAAAFSAFALAAGAASAQIEFPLLIAEVQYAQPMLGVTPLETVQEGRSAFAPAAVGTLTPFDDFAPIDFELAPAE